MAFLSDLVILGISIPALVDETSKIADASAAEPVVLIAAPLCENAAKQVKSEMLNVKR